VRVKRAAITAQRLGQSDVERAVIRKY